MLSKRFQDNLAAKFLVYSFVVIVAAMPVHTFFTTWLASNTGGEEVIKAWKEILIFFNVFALLYLLKTNQKLILPILKRPINVLIIAYIGLHLIIWVIRMPDLDAAVAGVMVNGRFLSIFVMAQVVVKLVKKKAFEVLIHKVFFTGAGIVAIVGFMQALVLDKDILTHFGYGPDTVRAFTTLDDNDSLIRINSTLRGPNPLAAYLILPILAVIHRLKRQITPKALYGLLFLSVAMLFTFSRSGWIGFAVAFVIYVLIVLARYPARLNYAIAALFVLVLFGLSAITVWRNTYVVQTYLFHDDPNTGGALTSNDVRIEALTSATEDVLENPLGDGPGTAGPASRYNDDVTRIGENYFLQVGQEVGVIGLGLFMAINMIVAIQLWRKRREPWPRMLFASFVGLTLVSMFLHGWADDTTSIIWWAFAGLYYD